MQPTFPQWFARVKPSKTAYFWSELRPLLEQCWEAASPKKKMTRSLKQNAYMFGVVYKYISEFTGYETSTWDEELQRVVGLDKDEVHTEMGRMFLSYEKNGREYVKSTTKLKTGEMEDYLATIRKWAAMELYVTIPLPNEPDNFFYEVK